MSEISAEAPATPALDRAAPASTWAAGGKRRAHEPLKLLGAMRGAGTLVWSDLAIPTRYELDVYGRGTGRTASGNLDGDFSSLLANDPEGERRMYGARLRLSDGRELEVDLIDLEATGAGFDAHGPAVDAGLLPQLLHA